MKPLVGFEENYLIDELGNIFSIRNRHGVRKHITPVSKSLVGSRGHLYYGANIYKNGKNHRLLLHRMLALTFIPNTENKPHINHIDGNKLNNSLSNLEWVTHRENINHALAKTRKYPTGVSLTKNKKWEAKISINNKSKTLGRFSTQAEASRAYMEYVIKLNDSYKYAY